MSWSLAIDFGTSNTAAAYRLEGQVPRPVRLSDQADQMPSAVLAADGGIRVGTEAVRSHRVAPERFVESPKLHIGQDAVLLGGDEVEVVDLVAAVLGHAARRSARAAGSEVPDRVVLTCPYEWAEPRRRALRSAWERTGIRAGVVELVSEPVAAVSFFAAHAAVPPVGSHVGVFDFGGGTCDVAILRHTGEAAEPWQVVGHDGRGDLGGRVVDQLLLGHVRRTLVRVGHGELERALSAPENLGALRTLQEHVRQAKHALSDWEDATVPVVVGAGEVSIVVTAAELEHLVGDLIAQARVLTERTLRQAGIGPGDLHAMYLTGGSSHLRPVAAMLEDLLGGRPATMEDPKLVVALGAHHAHQHTDVTVGPPGERPSESATASKSPPHGAAGLLMSSPDTSELSPATRRLLQAQPSLAAAVATVPGGARLLDDHAVLTAVLAVPGLLEEITARPARLAELGSGPDGEILSAPDADAAAVLPVRVFFADIAAWQRAADDAEWRRRFWERGAGASWAAHAVAAWNALPTDQQPAVLADPGWQPEHTGVAPPEVDWLYSDDQASSVWIASTGRDSPTPAAAVEQPVGLPRPLGPTPQQSVALDLLEQRGAFEDQARFRRLLERERDLVSEHGLVSVLFGPRRDRGIDGRYVGRLYLSVDPATPFALLDVPRVLVLTPDLVTSIGSKVYPNDPILRFPSIPRRTVLRTTSRPGATDPPSGVEVHLFASQIRDLTGLLRRHLGR